MTASLSPVAKQQFFDANGNPLAGGKVYTYQAGTTTPLATYTDSTGGTANPNPIILNAAGEANIWLGAQTYKFILKNANDVLQWTVDNIAPGLSSGLLASGVLTWLESPSSANFFDAMTDQSGSGLVVGNDSPSFITPALGTPASGVLTSCTGLPLTTGVTGTLEVTHGGTGATSLAANAVVLGNGTAAVQTVAPGDAGNLLTSNGTTWTSVAAGGISASIYGVAYISSTTHIIQSPNVKITMSAGGGGGGSGMGNGEESTGGGGGGAGGVLIKYLTGLTIGNTLTITIGVGGASNVSGGASSVSSGTQVITTLTCTGGGNGASGTGGGGGSAANGTLNFTGGAGAGFGTVSNQGGANILSSLPRPNYGNTPTIGFPGLNYGGGATGGIGIGNAGGTGAGGVVLIEW